MSNKYGERILNGIIKENPTFVMMLGMCPTLAVTTGAMNGLGMGLTTMVVLTMSNFIISLLRKVIPNKVRIPAFIVIVASMVTIVQLLLQAYIPSLYSALGIYIPLIVVNCIILGRADAYASKNGPLLSICDGIGMGLGFTVGLTSIGIVRELLGAGAIFGFEIFGDWYKSVEFITGNQTLYHVCDYLASNFTGIGIFVMAPGAFFVLAMLCAWQNKMKMPSATNTPEAIGAAETLSCNGNCASCIGAACALNHRMINEQVQAKKEEELQAKAAAAKKNAVKKANAEEHVDNAGKAGKEEGK